MIQTNHSLIRSLIFRLRSCSFVSTLFKTNSRSRRTKPPVWQTLRVQRLMWERSSAKHFSPELFFLPVFWLLVANPSIRYWGCHRIFSACELRRRSCSRLLRVSLKRETSSRWTCRKTWKWSGSAELLSHWIHDLLSSKTIKCCLTIQMIEHQEELRTVLDKNRQQKEQLHILETQLSQQHKTAQQELHTQVRVSW